MGSRATEGLYVKTFVAGVHRHQLLSALLLPLLLLLLLAQG
jgi:hypothetical protein